VAQYFLSDGNIMKPNKEQLGIIQNTEGNVLIQAGPGTGKTRTLNACTEKLIRCNGTAPENILILMFNNSIRDEINAQQSKAKTSAVVHTFHSFGLSLIVNNFSILGFTSPPTLDNKSDNEISYNEMLSLAIKLANSHPKQFRKSVSHYEYLFVDELQDINKQHSTLILRLAKHINNVIMFGDKKQAINSFMGADLKFWNRLEKKLKPKKFQLTITYRLPAASLPLINRIGKIIAPNDLPLVSNNTSDKKIVYKTNTKNGVLLMDKNKQAEFIASKVAVLINDKGVLPNQIVCLGRTNKQLMQLYNALLGYGLHTDRRYSTRTTDIHLTITREILSLSLWHRKHKKQRNHTLHTEFPAFIQNLLQLLDVKAKHKHLITAAIKERGLAGFHIKKTIDEKLYRDLLKFRETINEIADGDEPERAIEITIRWLSPVLKRVYATKKNKEWKFFMQQDLSDIKVISRQYPSLSNDVIAALQVTPIKTDDRVQLATCNYAKGREWEYVFIPHFVDGVYPYYLSKKKNKKKADEELRLFYVAITRHRVRLCLIECPLHERGYTSSSAMYPKVFTKQSHFIEI